MIVPFFDNYGNEVAYEEEVRRKVGVDDVFQRRMGIGDAYACFRSQRHQNTCAHHPWKTHSREMQELQQFHLGLRVQKIHNLQR